MKIYKLNNISTKQIINNLHNKKVNRNILLYGVFNLAN